MRKIKTLFAFLLCFNLFLVNAQDEEKPVDVEGSKDHPMLTRMPNFYIQRYEQNFDRVEMTGAGGNFIYPEGTKTYITYFFDETSGQKKPGPYQILKNYEAALKKIDGMLVYSNNEFVSTFSLKKNGATTWIGLESGEGFYYLTIVEVEALKQEVAANELYKQLSEQGSVALYINFETGKSTIQPESLTIIDEVAKMLKENPSLTVSIEGHTDNVGTPASNKTLSLNRAKSVVNALVGKGIAATRLSSAGWGQEKPIGDNSTESGRASNRRVEIVKK